jgi:hypothetical protein
MASRCLEFEPGKADAEGQGVPENASFLGWAVAAHVQEHGRRGPRRRIVFGAGCRRVSNSARAADDARADFRITSGIILVTAEGL